MFRAGPSQARQLSTHLRRALATHATAPTPPPTRHSWTKQEIQGIYDTPLMDLVFRAASVHRQYHDPSKIQLCTLMNIKSESRLRPPRIVEERTLTVLRTLAGGCTEDCRLPHFPREPCGPS